MELKILEDKKDKLRFQLIGEGHTLCNALKQELVKNKNVEYATYKVHHPLVGIPEMVISTKGESPKDALKLAIAGLKKANKGFAEAFEKLK
jgi:DNA-directed RNA polymerase subunit L